MYIPKAKFNFEVSSTYVSINCWESKSCAFKKMSEVKLSFMTGAFHYKGAGANARSRVGAGEEYGARAEVEPLGEYLQD